MTREQFMSGYSPQHKMMVTYTDKYGSTRKGIALQEPVKTLSGIHAVYVDSFANRVLVTNIHKVENTGKLWTEVK